MRIRNLSITFSLVLCIVLLFSIPVNAGENNKMPMRILAYDLQLLPHLGIISDEGRLLVWKGPVKGDVQGFIVWWFDLPGKDPLIQEDFGVGFYSSKWEIYDSDPYPPDGSGGVVHNPDAGILMAGLSAGETLTPLDPAGSNGIWNGFGKVTEASKEHRQWIRCVTYEGGPVVYSAPEEGPGKIYIYPRGFRPGDLLNKPAADVLEEHNVPEELGLLKNYPNPFNPSTNIEFKLNEATQVKIDIYNNAGQKVKTLLNQQMQAGNHKVEWNASDMASGIYYYKIQANGVQDVERMILVK
jgi:hypothetical protein